MRDDLWGFPGLLELTLILILVTWFLRWKITAFLRLILLIVWGYLQFISHWYGFIFEVSNSQLHRYYALFAGTYRFFPESSTRIIPDAYHMILGLLILINLVLRIFHTVSLYSLRTAKE